MIGDWKIVISLLLDLHTYVCMSLCICMCMCMCIHTGVTVYAMCVSSHACLCTYCWERHQRGAGLALSSKLSDSDSVYVQMYAFRWGGICLHCMYTCVTTCDTSAGRGWPRSWMTAIVQRAGWDCHSCSPPSTDRAPVNTHAHGYASMYVLIHVNLHNHPPTHPHTYTHKHSYACLYM